MSAQPPHVTGFSEPHAPPAQSVRCTKCGYGAVLRTESRPCPMCHTTSWEPDRWRPFSHLHDFWGGSDSLPPSAAS
jgi:hypothetical protein